jgi:ribose/xylose/arabinose/galactoside ABC-type transport system permease subunit
MSHQAKAPVPRDTETLGGVVPTRRVPLGRRVLANRRLQELWTFVAFCMLFAGFSLWLGGRFDNVVSRLLDVHTNAPVLLLALAAMVTLIGGQFDLSISGMATLSTFILVGTVINDGWPMWAAILLVAIIGSAGGFLNAIFVVGLRMNAFIVTLATNGLFLGASEIYSNGTAITPTSTGRQLPSWFTSLGSYPTKFPHLLVWAALAVAAVVGFAKLRRLRPVRVPKLTWEFICILIAIIVVGLLFGVFHLASWVSDTSWLVGLLLAVAFGMWILVDRTTFGRNLRATGANREAARLAGVPTRRVTVLAFAIGGLLAAMAGVVLAAAVGSAQPGVATDLLLPAFAATFLSTVLFSSGQFNVWGTIVGGIFLVWVGQALILGGLNFTWGDVVNAVVLLGAVAFYSILTRRRAQ